jgi:hypothetical protein
MFHRLHVQFSQHATTTNHTIPNLCSKLTPNPFRHSQIRIILKYFLKKGWKIVLPGGAKLALATTTIGT